MQHNITQALRFALGISFFTFILIGINDGAVGVLLPGMQTTYHTGKGTISLLFLAGTCGYFIASFNNGLLLEKLGNRRFLLLATLIMGLGFAIFSSRPPFFLLLLGIIPIGFGGAMLDAGLNSYIARLPDNTARLNYLPRILWNRCIARSTRCLWLPRSRVGLEQHLLCMDWHGHSCVYRHCSRLPP